MASVAHAPASLEAAPAALPAREEHAAAPAEHAAATPAAHGESHDAEHDAHIAHMAHSYAMWSSVTVAGLGILLAFGIYILGWVDPNAMAERFKPL